MELFQGLDNLHFNFRTIDGYNKPFNAIISEREAGKSTAAWLLKAYKAFKEEGRTTIIFKRQVVDITDIFISDIEQIINKFAIEPITIEFKNSSIKDGIIDLKIDGQRFVRIAALSIKISRLKSLMLRNLKFMIFDEFICNPKFDEKYLSSEWDKFREVFNTFQRECPDVKSYFLGNPYSLYNPYFVGWGVDTRKLKPGAILSGSNWVVQCYQILPELKEAILARNPLYQFDDDYKRYAFDGININDSNIRLGTIGDNFSLKFIFYIEGCKLALYANNFYDEYYKFFCKKLNTYTGKKDVISLSVDDLVEKTILLHPADKLKFYKLKDAFRKRNIVFETIECYYLLESIYLVI